MQKYTIKTLQYEDGILNNCVDVTYIIHLEGNGREPDIMKQLQKIHPTNTVHIVYNKGYRKCGKDLGITNPTDDLVHCYLWIFEHYKSSQKDNATRKKNVLILEDDFIFNDKIAEIETRKQIENTLETIQHNRFSFRLGCIPFLIFPCTAYAYAGVSAGTHCIIYNEECVDYNLSNREYIKDWDVYNNFHTKQYIYKEPLCYQFCPETENQKTWGGGNIFLKIMSRILIKYLQLLRLDKQVEPGYSTAYKIGLLLTFILMFLVLYIFYYVFSNYEKLIYFLKYTSKTRSSVLRRR
jgi:hypothetical protein